MNLLRVLSRHWSFITNRDTHFIFFIGSQVANVTDGLNLRVVPIIHLQRLHFTYVTSHVAMEAGTLRADENPEVVRCPFWP